MTASITQSKLFPMTVRLLKRILVILLFIPMFIWNFVRAGESEVKHPEKLWRVEELEGKIICTSPDGSQTSVVWNELISLQVETNSFGPFSPDFFWILKDSRATCRFPSGAAGESELKEKLLALPNIDLELFVTAATSTKKEIFEIWSAT